MTVKVKFETSRSSTIENIHNFSNSVKEVPVYHHFQYSIIISPQAEDAPLTQLLANDIRGGDSYRNVFCDDDQQLPMPFLVSSNRALF